MTLLITANDLYDPGPLQSPSERRSTARVLIRAQRSRWRDAIVRHGHSVFPDHLLHDHRSRAGDLWDRLAETVWHWHDLVEHPDVRRRLLRDEPERGSATTRIPTRRPKRRGLGRRPGPAKRRSSQTSPLPSATLASADAQAQTPVAVPAWPASGPAVSPGQSMQANFETPVPPSGRVAKANGPRQQGDL